MKCEYCNNYATKKLKIPYPKEYSKYKLIRYFQRLFAKKVVYNLCKEDYAIHEKCMRILRGWGM